MAVLFVTEFNSVYTQNGPLAVPNQTPVAEQTVAIGGTTTQSSAFNARTRFVRLHTDAICSVAFGTNPTATATKMRMAQNESVLFSVPEGQSYKVAVITNT